MTFSIAALTGALCAGLLAAAPAAAQNGCEGAPSNARLRVIVEGVHSDKGLMTATLYPDDASKFLKKGGALVVWRNPASAPVTAMCVWLPGPGSYAVAVYHDANSNMKWDHAMLGEIEGFGFSNNPRIFFSAPSLGAVRFQAPAGDTTLHVRLSYR